MGVVAMSQRPSLSPLVAFDGVRALAMKFADESCRLEQADKDFRGRASEY
jgi:hypothetical protein